MRGGDAAGLSPPSFSKSHRKTINNVTQIPQISQILLAVGEWAAAGKIRVICVICETKKRKIIKISEKYEILRNKRISALR